eukprot:gene1289-742_t
MKVATNTAKILRNVPLPDEVAVTHNNATVIDMGGYSTRIGFAGDNAPRMNERTVVVKGDGEIQPNGQTNSLCFDKAYDSPDEAGIVHVMKNGMVADWEGYEQLIQHVDDILQLSNMEMNNPLLVTEKALVPHSQRMKMAEILFEKHHVNACFFALSPVLALYASGICTGVSVEMGHGQCHVAPVFQGFSHFHATHCLPVGGVDLTMLLQERSPAKLPPSVLARRELDTWAYLKEVCGYAMDSKSSFSSATHSPAAERYRMSHRLPDGTVMTIGAERFIPAEVFFQPSVLMPQLKDFAARQSEVESEVLLRTFSSPVKGIHELVVDAVKKCDHDLAATFLDNILLSGGSSLFAGLPDRLEAEVQSLLPASADRVRVVAEVERRGAAFIGGSILASLPSFQSLWVTRKEYEELGSISVVRGCFNA